MPDTDNQQNAIIGRLSDARQIHKDFEIPGIPNMGEPICPRILVAKSNTGIMYVCSLARAGPYGLIEAYVPVNLSVHISQFFLNL